MSFRASGVEVQGRGHEEALLNMEPDRPHSPLAWPGSFSFALEADVVFGQKNKT